MVVGNKAKIFDADLELKDDALVAATAAAEVGGSAKILDLGLGLVEGDMVVIYNAIEFGSADETYDIILQLSQSPTFASGIVNRVSVQKGDARQGSDLDKISLDKDIVPFSNEWEGVKYQFARAFTVVGGTIATGINYEAFLTKS